MQAGSETRADERNDAPRTARLFQGGPVLCDGAMGTMLYGCGVFINRSYDELNVTQPDTVRNVHEQYLQAGAEVIETNTFGANAIRLEHYGLREKVRELNVAGAIGSLGVTLGSGEGQLAPEQAKAIFAEQMAALAEGGVDLLIAETMMS